MLTHTRLPPCVSRLRRWGSGTQWCSGDTSRWSTAGAPPVVPVRAYTPLPPSHSLKRGRRRPEMHPSILLLVGGLLLSLRLADAQPSPAPVQAYIRVVQDHGVWWFQDGAGHQFFSLGVNCIG